jgi:hypothetical protein
MSLLTATRSGAAILPQPYSALAAALWTLYMPYSIRVAVPWKAWRSCAPSTWASYKSVAYPATTTPNEPAGSGAVGQEAHDAKPTATTSHPIRWGNSLTAAAPYVLLLLICMGEPLHDRPFSCTPREALDASIQPDTLCAPYLPQR